MLSLLALLLCFTPAWAGEQPSIPVDDKPMQIDGRLPRSGLVTTSPEPIPEGLEEVEMLRESLGLISVIQPKTFSTLNRLAKLTDSDEQLGEGEPAGYIQTKRGASSKVFSIHKLDPETLLLVQSDAPDRRWTIRADVFERLDISLDPAPSRDGFESTREALSLELPSPHIESPIVLDSKTVRSRIRISFPRLTRVVGQETFRVRLPKNYNPDTPAGVLVWISPNEAGRIPEIFEPICDELGFIAIGVDLNGNTREITDRLQNHLDSIETLAQHAFIDRDRVYLTGMSGGGRCSGILQLAFPEHFAGAVPIVGLDTYHNAPTGNGAQYWPKRLGKPTGSTMKLVKERRIRSITGSADFNEPEMTLRTKLLSGDGIEAKVDVIEGMGHSMPNALQFSTALRWVDEPRLEAIEQNTKRAEQILDETSDQDPDLAGVRRKLIEVMQMLPYSEQAWQAAGRLGYQKPN